MSNLCCAVEQIKRIAINVEVEKNIYVALDIYTPKNPKAILVVSPGSEGFGENIERALNEKINSPQKPDELIKTVNDANYAIAYFWQRGFIRSNECLKGNGYEERKKIFLANCYVPSIRGTVDLNTITLDTEKVYRALASNATTKHLPVIALAISEGSYHVSKLVELKAIQPKGIVFIGGMFDSLRATAEYQLRKDFYFEKIDLTFKITGKEYISFADLVKHGNLNIFIEPPGKPPWGAAVAMGNIQINKEEAANRKRLFSEEFEKFLTVHAHMPVSTPVNGNFDGTPWYSSASFNYFPQILNAKTKIVDQLASYDGRVVFLYGSFESLVKLPSSTSCPYGLLKCRVEIVQGVGHVLQDRFGYKPKNSLRTILAAVNEVDQND